MAYERAGYVWLWRVEGFEVLETVRASRLLGRGIRYIERGRPVDALETLGGALALMKRRHVDRDSASVLAIVMIVSELMSELSLELDRPAVGADALRFALAMWDRQAADQRRLHRSSIIAEWGPRARERLKTLAAKQP